MIPGRKLMRKVTQPRSHLGEPAKAESRFGTRNNSLPHLADTEVSDVSKSSLMKGVRSTSGDSASPTVSNPPLQYSRSVSVSKLKSKQFNMGQAKARPTLRSDFACRPKKHRKGGKSLQFGAESVSLLQRSFVVSRDPQWSTPQSAAGKAFGTMKGDVLKLGCDTPNPSGTTEISEGFDITQAKQSFMQAVRSVPPAETRTKLRVFHRFFSEVIRASGPLGVLLANFKEGYETMVEELQEKYTREVARLQGEIITLQNNILQEAEERKSLLKKIDKLSRENIEMSETCENYEGKVNDFQEKLFDIANVKLDDYPPSEDAWRLLNSELDYYKSWKKKISRELKISQAKEEKLVRLAHALKARGFPVEEVYETEVKTPAPTRSHQAVEDDSVRLVSSKGKGMSKPEKVPALHFEDLEPYVSSSEESSVPVPREAMTLRKTLSDLSTHMMTEELDRSRSSTLSKDQHR